MKRCGSLLFLLWTSAASAHPHVFMDTAVEVILNEQDEAVALQITWTYDDFYSLSTVSDMGLDPDGDGQLTPEENEELSGFDMKWIEGFEGDTYALMDDKPLVLSGPRDWTAV